jgi:4-diphosphocytidyl-2-C-methyl-D-erythritol kinase
VIESRAYAKLTLSLHVGAIESSGLHPIDGRFQSIDWCDFLTIASSEDDEISDGNDGSVVDGQENLAWRAAVAARDVAVTRPPLAITLRKRLPIAAGLGGGSADAAATLGSTGLLLGVDRSVLAAIAPSLGSDVPFCFAGGSARVSGLGDRVEPLPPSTGFAVAVVVPPIEVRTADVYRAWDRLDGPRGPTIPPAAAPPSLRDEELVNDLLPAAVHVAAEIGEWRTELTQRWGRPVGLAGSGPSLFAFFVDRDEAASAVAAAPSEARMAAAASPVDHGWMARVEGAERGTDSKGRVVSADEW